MEKNMNRNYTELNLDNNGRGIGRFYKNPLTKVFQYEYAMYTAVSELFARTECRSMCTERLKLYFRELPDGEENAYALTRESVLTEMKNLVSRDVAGKVSFPMMHLCSAEVRIAPRDDGTHKFIFTDGIYGFSLYLDTPRKGHPRKIVVTNLQPEKAESDGKDRQSHDEHQARVERHDYAAEPNAA